MTSIDRPALQNTHQRYYEPSISFPVRTQEHVDYVKELRANQAIRLWIDRTKEPPRARAQTRASIKQQQQQQQQQQHQQHQTQSAAFGIDVNFLPSPPPSFGGRRRVTSAKCSPTESTSTSPQSENDEPSSNYQPRRAKKRRGGKAASPARNKARSALSPQPTASGMSFLTHFFSNVGAGVNKQY
jgi:hypothetical protein